MDNSLKAFMAYFWIAFEHPFSPWFCLWFMLTVAVSDLWKKRKEAKARTATPWFPPHLVLARQIYNNVVVLQIKHLQELSESNPQLDLGAEMEEARYLHNAALIKWATEALRRALAIKDQNDACKILAAQGSIGEEMARWVANAEKVCEEELKKVSKLARATTSDEFADRIMSCAYNIMDREDLDKKLAAIEEKREEEKAWWEARRQCILSELVKELGEEDLGMPTQRGSGNNRQEGNGESSKNGKIKGGKGKAKGKK
ncbi:hypothetical protein HYALB_00007405 [Hymenoscyphus albidus]|uniref:Translocation protein sec66 n=1 Tax=Hymenoscyphus albidus TaxID=595503 RepID=A0A9N9LRV4_9HELO|nr:hypothetical protein HYALB_00007405 [Hymenoscyphus albidus]